MSTEVEERMHVNQSATQSMLVLRCHRTIILRQAVIWHVVRVSGLQSGGKATGMTHSYMHVLGRGAKSQLGFSNNLYVTASQLAWADADMVALAPQAVYSGHARWAQSCGTCTTCQCGCCLTDWLSWTSSQAWMPAPLPTMRTALCIRTLLVSLLHRLQTELHTSLLPN